jgi:hypothetical protein
MKNPGIHKGLQNSRCAKVNLAGRAKFCFRPISAPMEAARFMDLIQRKPRRYLTARMREGSPRSFQFPEAPKRAIIVARRANHAHLAGKERRTLPIVAGIFFVGLNNNGKSNMGGRLSAGFGKKIVDYQLPFWSYWAIR